MKIKFKMDVEIILLTLLITICSYQSIFATKLQYLDEIMIIVILAYEIANKLMAKTKIDIKKYKMKIILFSIFIILTLINCVIKQYNFLAYMEEILNYLKVLIIIEIISLIKIDNNKLEKIMKIFIWINFISIIWGITKCIFYDEIQMGDKFRNGHYRIAGLSGHPITLGFICTVINMYLIEKSNKKRYEKIIFILTTIALYLTYSRLPQMLFICYVICKVCQYIIQKFSITKKKVIVTSIALLIIISTIGIMQKDRMIKYLEADINDTIRFYALEKSYEVFKKYPVLGTGIGTFSCNASVKYDSYVYEMFKFDRFTNIVTENSGNIFESYLAKIIIETGLIGVIFYMICFAYYYKEAFKTRNFLLVSMITVLIINMILNTIYQIPFVIILAIIISNNNWKIQVGFEDNN